MINATEGNIVAKELNDSEKSILVTMNDDKKKKEKATVVSAHESSPFKEGDVVMFAKYASSKFEVDGEKFITVPEDEIFATLT